MALVAEECRYRGIARDLGTGKLDVNDMLKRSPAQTAIREPGLG